MINGPVRIQYEGRVRTIGEIQGDTFIKIVRLKKHLQTTLDAWGVDANTFTNLVKKHCNWIIVIDTDNKLRYKVDVMTAEAQGQFQHHKPHRAQLFIPRNLFTITPYEKR